MINMHRLLEFDGFKNSDLKKIYLFARSDRFSFSHIDSLVRSVADNIFQMITPPGIFPNMINKKYPVYNYGNYDELKLLIQRGDVNADNVYNNPENLINANSKVEFHKKTEGLDFVPKTVFTKEDAIGKLKFPVIAKPSGGSKGEGIQVFKDKDGLEKSKADNLEVFSEKFDLKREFRAISICGKVVFIAERVPTNEKAKSLREEDIFDRDGTLDQRSSYVWETVEFDEEIKKDVVEDMCKKVCDAIELEVLGIDVGLDSKGKLFVIEANTCPGLNKDQVVLIYHGLFEDFFGRKPDEKSTEILKSYSEELLRANADPAKFSFSPNGGRKFFNFSNAVDANGDEKGKNLMTVKFDLEKQFGGSLKSIKNKYLNMDEGTVYRFDEWQILTEDASLNESSYLRFKTKEVFTKAKESLEKAGIKLKDSVIPKDGYSTLPAIIYFDPKDVEAVKKVLKAENIIPSAFFVDDEPLEL